MFSAGIVLASLLHAQSASCKALASLSGLPESDPDATQLCNEILHEQRALKRRRVRPQLCALLELVRRLCSRDPDRRPSAQEAISELLELESKTHRRRATPLATISTNACIRQTRSAVKLAAAAAMEVDNESAGGDSTTTSVRRSSRLANRPLQKQATCATVQ